METLQEPTTENKMGVMPVGKLIWNMSLPMMIAMLVQAMYNIVDSVFVAKLSENALTAVSLAFPLQTLIIAVCAGTGVGMNALLSKSLGERNFKRANDTANNGALIFFLSGFVFLILGCTVVRPFYAGQTRGADPEIFEYGVSYLTIVMSCAFGILAHFYFDRLLTSTGKTVYSMIAQLSGAVTNIILDPIMIFGLLGCPAMGVTGAAVATVIGQCLGACVGAFCHFKYNKEISINLKGYRPDGEIIWKIYQVGIPSIVMQSIGSVMTYCMNLILMSFSATATAVFGVYFKLQSIFFMPIFGLNNGITPIIAYSYGAQQKKRMMKTIRLSMVIGCILLLVGFLVFESVPGFLLGFFDASEEMLAIGVPALRSIAFSFLLAWFAIISCTVFQALGYAFFSMIVSVMRQLVVLVPAAYVLAKLGGLHAVWWSFPIAEMMSGLLSVIFLVWIYRKVIRPLPEGRC